MRRFSVRVLLTALVLLSAQGRARAQAHDAAAAEALFTDGRAAMKRGDYPAAYAKFVESETLDPSAVGTLLNLAECEEHLGKVASAWQHLRRALDQLPARDDRVAYAAARAAALEKQLPRLTIRLAATAPPSTHVRRGDIDVGAGSLGVALPEDPGSYEVVASAPGFMTRRFAVELRPGEVTDLLVDVGAPLAVAVEPEASPASLWRTTGLVIGGVGIAGVGVGAATGVLAIERNDTMNQLCNSQSPRVCSSPAGVTAGQQGQVFATTSTVSFVVAGALLATGLVLVLTHPKRAPATPAVGAVR